MKSRQNTAIQDTDLIADLVVELIASAYGRGEGQTGPDDPDIRLERFGLAAIRRGDVRGMKKWHERLFDRRHREWKKIEKLYGPRAVE